MTTPPADIPAAPPSPARSLVWTLPWLMLAALAVTTLVQHPLSDIEAWRARGFFPVLLGTSLLAVALLVVRAIRSARAHREFMGRWSAAERAAFLRMRYAREQPAPPLAAGSVAAVLALSGAALVAVFAPYLAERPGGLSSALAVVVLIGAVAVRLLESGIRRLRASRRERPAGRLPAG